MHRKSPFVTCPVYETRSFKLRLVRKEDAAGLLACYADQDAVSSLCKLTGDYDGLENETAVIALLHDK